MTFGSVQQGLLDEERRVADVLDFEAGTPHPSSDPPVDLTAFESVTAPKIASTARPAPVLSRRTFQLIFKRCFFNGKPIF